MDKKTEDWELEKMRFEMPPLTETMSGAEHYFMDIKTRIAHPSDDAVDEMRDWSIENKK